MIICLHFTGQCDKLIRIAIMLIILAWSTEGVRTISDHHTGDQTAWCLRNACTVYSIFESHFPLLEM